MTNRSRTLEQLEGVWGEPEYDSYLVGTIHALRRKPIGEFTIEDLRIALGQAIGVSHLAPLALEELDANPLAGGDFYPGDLLASVLELPPEYWAAHPAEARRMEGIAQRVTHLLEGPAISADIKSYLRAMLAKASWRAA